MISLYRGIFYTQFTSLYREYRYIEDRYIGVLSHKFYCNFCRDIAYSSLYRGYRYIEDRYIGVALYCTQAFKLLKYHMYNTFTILLYKIHLSSLSSLKENRKKLVFINNSKHPFHLTYWSFDILHCIIHTKNNRCSDNEDYSILPA